MNYKQMLQMIGLALLAWLLVGCGAPTSQISETPLPPPAENQTAIALTATPPTVALPVETTYTTDICLNNTSDEAKCKDCCDSLDADGAARKACRDECPTHDFAQNTDFVTVDAPSILGPNGDYGACTLAVDEQTCKECCDGSPDLQSGDRRFCRDACAQSPAGNSSPEQKPGESDRAPDGRTPPQEAIAACNGKSERDACEFTAQRGPETGVCETVQDQLACSPQRERLGEGQTGGNQAPGGNPEGKGAAHNIEQALSDRAQRTTISFDALAFLTGDLGSDSFFPPGKVADFWGFQYLRDNDPSEMGHNTDFLTKAAFNMLHVLTPAQRVELIALAEDQVDSINEYGHKRFVLMDAFRRLLEGDLPAGTTGLDEQAVQAYSAELYRLDGEISFERAQVMGGMLSSLDATQRAYLDSMVGQGMLEWPAVEEPSDLRNLDRNVKVAVMTYAGDMFSWYAGSVEADVYFCPERQGTYFGSFYLKDAPAMGNPDYTISSNLTGDMGDAMLGTLTAGQAQLVTNLVDIQRPYLLGIVDARQEVSIELRRFMAGESPDSATVLSLMEEYGELDGAIVYNFATNFAQLDQSLTGEQRAQLMALRTQMLGDLMYPSGAYLYSQPIAMPEIPDTDFLFGR